MKYQDLWPLIQQDVLGLLSAHELIGARPGVAVEPGATGDELDRKITQVCAKGKDDRIGIGFFVLPIEQASDDNASLPGGPLKLRITVQFVENVTLNRGPRGTQLPCRVWIAVAEKALKLYTPVGLTQNFVPASPVIHEFTPDKDEHLRVGQLEFTAIEADFQPFTRVNRPQISVLGVPPSGGSGNSYQLIGQATVIVTAPDADPNQIYYTTDNSHPWEGNPTAQVYNGPVQISAPCLFRCRAFAPSAHKIGSDTAAANFWQ
jgi:hypothetical protein